MHSYYLLSLLSLSIGLSWSFAFIPRNDNDRVIYFQDNDPAGNAIVALKRSNNDGTLSSPVRTSTNGTGLAALFGPSQDSVVVSDNYLLTTNAGDHTLSLFQINERDPQHLELLGKPADTLGETPVSVAYSAKLKTACAMNSGATARVTCFSVSSSGLEPLGGLRSIPQTENTDPTRPLPPGPLSIGQDIVFNPSSSALFVTVRSNGGQPGLIYAFPVSNGQVSTKQVVSQFPDLPFAFSLNFLDGSDERLFVTNPDLNAPGAAIVSVSYPSLKITTAKTVASPGQMAACWAAPAPRQNEIFVIDAVQANVSVVDIKSGDIKGQAQYPAPPMTGGIDSVFAEKWLYTLTDDLKAPKILVFELVRGLPTLVQSFDVFSTVGQIPAWMGLAIWG